MRNGADLTISLVEEEGQVIGYGIGRRTESGTEVTILDVDGDSRRHAGLAKKFSGTGETFQVGVGHIALLVLLKACSGPFYTDATTSASRYIFKSLGFTSTDPGGNPCLLNLPGFPPPMRNQELERSKVAASTRRAGSRSRRG